MGEKQNSGNSKLISKFSNNPFWHIKQIKPKPITTSKKDKKTEKPVPHTRPSEQPSPNGLVKASKPSVRTSLPRQIQVNPRHIYLGIAALILVALCSRARRRRRRRRRRRSGNVADWSDSEFGKPYPAIALVRNSNGAGVGAKVRARGSNIMRRRDWKERARKGREFKEPTATAITRSARKPEKCRRSHHCCENWNTY